LLLGAVNEGGLGNNPGVTASLAKESVRYGLALALAEH